MNDADRLAILREYRVLDTPPEAAFNDLIELAAAICDVPMAAFTLVDESRQWFKARIGLPMGETPRDVSFCSHAIGAPALLVVPDAERDPRFAGSVLVTESPHIRFYAGLPLVSPEGAAIGTV